MKVTYHLTAHADIAVGKMPSSLQIETVDVEWLVQDGKLTGVDLIFRNQPMPAAQMQSKITDARDPDREIVAYRISSYSADTVYSLTGIDALRPEEIIGQIPDAAAETPQEERYFPMVVMRGMGRIEATGSLARKLNGTAVANRHPTAIAHFARAMRNRDPFDAYEEYFKAIECFIGTSPKGKQLKEMDADVDLSGKVSGVDASYTAARIGDLREIRNRIVHPQAYQVHLSPHELKHIAEVRTHLPDVQRLATILIWGTPTPWL